ncbi:MAG: hypothetical protein M0Z85_04295 [Gammaproteobacteria bacterium]|nr:hypothetical protein [Gammaproteobacteria bacterium]
MTPHYFGESTTAGKILQCFSLLGWVVYSREFYARLVDGAAASLGLPLEPPM